MTEATDEPWTVLRLLDWTRQYFARGDVREPRLAAEVLLAHVLGCRRIDLYARFDHVPSKDQLAAYRGLVSRASRHEPVAYLVGEKEFYSLAFAVNADVLVPRPETEALVDEAVAHLRSLGRPGRVWDVCTGCGCVAIATAANVPTACVLATDISAGAVAVAQRNAERHGLGERVRCRVADLLALPDDCGDWRQCDVVTVNPPYVAEGDEIAEEVEHEPKVALYAGADGLDVIRRLIRQAPSMLSAGGKLMMEFGLGQVEEVCDLIAETGAFEDPQVLQDHQEIERDVVATRRP